MSAILVLDPCIERHLDIVSKMRIWLVISVCVKLKI